MIWLYLIEFKIVDDVGVDQHDHHRSDDRYGSDDEAGSIGDSAQICNMINKITTT